MFKKDKKKSSSNPNEINLDVNEAIAIKERLYLMAEKSQSEQERRDLQMASSLICTLINIFAVWTKSKKTVKTLLKKLFGNPSEKSRPITPEKPLIKGTKPKEKEKDDHGNGNETKNNGSQDKENKSSDNTNEEEEEEEDKKKRKGGNGRNSVDDYTNASEISIQLEPQFRPGEVCPECNENKIYQAEPLISIRLVGHAPVSAFKFIRAVSRCICGMVYKAKVPSDLQDLYNADKYGPSAIASILVYKYLMAVSFGLLGKVQSMHGIPLPASTQANQIKKYAVEVIQAVVQVLRYLAANSYLVGFDDTIIRLLEKRITKKNTKTNNGYGTAVLANQFDELDNVIVIYDFDFTKHAGDVVIELLKLREKDKNLPLLISDGLIAYAESKKQGIDANCNIHARRKVIEDDPGQKTYIGASIIDCYRNIYKNDQHCKNNDLSMIDRMNYHFENSKESFDKIKAIFEVVTGKIFSEKLIAIREKYNFPTSLRAVEPNDDLCSIAHYFLDRFEALTRVLYIPGVPLDTNYVERAIKAIIRIRNNSLFFENLESAKYSGDILSLLQTTNLNKINVFIYVEFLIANRDKVLESPRDYLPWLYDKDDEYKRNYWEKVKSINRMDSNSPEYPFSEQTHSNRLTGLLVNE